MNDLEVIRNIKRELFRMRREIDGMKKREEKKARGATKRLHKILLYKEIL